MRRSFVTHFANASTSVAQHRTPSIKFVGKRSKAPVLRVAVSPHPVSQPQPAAAAPKPVKVGTGVDFATLKGKAWFGRPGLSAKEMAAIESGGASDLDPEIPVDKPKKK